MDVDLDDEGGRFAAREVLGATLKPWVLARTLDEVRETFDRHGVSLGPLPDFHRAGRARSALLAREPDVRARSSSPASGRYLMPGSPLAFSDAERLPAAPRPLLGEHTDEVLADLLGLGDREIARLHDDGVVAGPAPAAV